MFQISLFFLAAEATETPEVLRSNGGVHFRSDNRFHVETSRASGQDVCGADILPDPKPLVPQYDSKNDRGTGP